MKIVDNILQPAREQAYISHTITGGKIMATKTINLTGAEVEVTGLDGAHAHIRNDGTEVIYAAKTAGITAGADGVASIPAGQSDTIRGISGAVYLLGTGSVLIQSDDYVASPFKTSTASGGSAVDEVARTAINTHAGNDEIHVTAEEKAAWNAVNYSNPNLLINPDFRINQRGQSEYTAAGYTVDRWATQSNCKLTPKSGGGVRLDCLDVTNNGFYQKYDGDLSGNTVTLSLKASGSGSLRLGVWGTSIKTVILDDTPRVYSHTFELGDDPSFGMWLAAKGEYAEIEWVKLELGNTATPFVPPETATELLKCRRYYQKLCFFRVPMAYHDNSSITWFIPFVPMRTIPSINLNTDGLYLDGLPSSSPQPTDFVLAWAAGTDTASASGCIRVNCSYSSSWDTSIANGSWNAPLTSNSNSSGIVLDAEL